MHMSINKDQQGYKNMGKFVKEKIEHTKNLYAKKYERKYPCWYSISDFEGPNAIVDDKRSHEQKHLTLRELLKDKVIKNQAVTAEEESQQDQYTTSCEECQMLDKQEAIDELFQIMMVGQNEEVERIDKQNQKDKID